MVESLEDRRHLYAATQVIYDGNPVAAGVSPVSISSNRSVNGTTLSYTVTGLPAHTGVSIESRAGFGWPTWYPDEGVASLTVSVGSTSVVDYNSDGSTFVGSTLNASHTGSSLTVNITGSYVAGGFDFDASAILINVFSPEVSITGGGNVAEDCAPRTLTVSRDGWSWMWGEDLEVPITLGGTATIGTGNDYTLSGPTLSGTTVTIPAGYGSTTFSLMPIDDGLYEPAEDAVISLQASTAYTLGNPSATVTLLQSKKRIYIEASDTTLETPPAGGTANVTLTGKDVNNAGVSLAGRIVTVSGSTTVPLPAGVSVSITAQANVGAGGRAVTIGIAGITPAMRGTTIRVLVNIDEDSTSIGSPVAIDILLK